MKILVDTSVFIDYLRTQTRENSSFAQLLDQGGIFASIITVGELYSGKSVQTEKGKEVVEKLLAGVEILYSKYDTAQKAGELRAKYNLVIADAFIAAEAIILNLPLATLDKKDFEKIKGLKII